MEYYLIPVVLFFILSLFGSFIFYKYLKSQAKIRELKLFNTFQAQIGGALAYFIIIFFVLFYAYSNIYNQMKREYEEPWTIQGQLKIVRQQNEILPKDALKVNYDPPPQENFQWQKSKTAGVFDFYIYKVIPIKKDIFPSFRLTADGYLPTESFSVVIERDTKDSVKNVIKLSKDLELALTKDPNPE